MYTEIDLLVYLATGLATGLFAGAGLGAFACWRWWLSRIEKLELL